MRLWKQKIKSENLVAGSPVQKNRVLEKSAATVGAIPSPVICIGHIILLYVRKVHNSH